MGLQKDIERAPVAINVLVPVARDRGVSRVGLGALAAGLIWGSLA